MGLGFRVEGQGLGPTLHMLPPHAPLATFQLFVIEWHHGHQTQAHLLHPASLPPHATLQLFLTEWRSGYYEHSKLANVLFGYEVQRRLGPLGVTSVVADPGGVRSNLWNTSPLFKQGLYRWVGGCCFKQVLNRYVNVVQAGAVHDKGMYG